MYRKQIDSTLNMEESKGTVLLNLCIILTAKIKMRMRMKGKSGTARMQEGEEAVLYQVSTGEQEL